MLARKACRFTPCSITKTLATCWHLLPVFITVVSWQNSSKSSFKAILHHFPRFDADFLYSFSLEKWDSDDVRQRLLYVLYSSFPHLWSYEWVLLSLSLPRSLGIPLRFHWPEWGSAATIAARTATRIWETCYGLRLDAEDKLLRENSGAPASMRCWGLIRMPRSFKTGIWAWSSSALKTFSLYSVQYLLFMGVPAWLFDEWTQLFHTIAWAESKSLLLAQVLRICPISAKQRCCFS